MFYFRSRQEQFEVKAQKNFFNFAIELGRKINGLGRVEIDNLNGKEVIVFFEYNLDVKIEVETLLWPRTAGDVKEYDHGDVVAAKDLINNILKAHCLGLEEKIKKYKKGGDCYCSNC